MVVIFVIAAVLPGELAFGRRWLRSYRPFWMGSEAGLQI